MKRTFIKLSAFATIGLVLASCNNEEANKKAQEADALAVQALVETKNLELDSAVWAECDAKVAVVADSIVAAAAKKAGVKKPVAKKPAAPAKPAAPKSDIGNKIDVGQKGSSTTNTNKIDVGQQSAPSTNNKKLNVGQKQP